MCDKEHSTLSYTRNFFARSPGSFNLQWLRRLQNTSYSLIWGTIALYHVVSRYSCFSTRSPHGGAIRPMGHTEPTMGCTSQGSQVAHTGPYIPGAGSTNISSSLSTNTWRDARHTRLKKRQSSLLHKRMLPGVQQTRKKIGHGGDCSSRETHEGLCCRKLSSRPACVIREPRHGTRPLSA